MNTNGQQDGIKGRKLKTIIVSTIAFIVVLFVGIWAISGALNSGKKTTENTKPAEVSKTEEKKNNSTPVEGTAPTSPSTQYSPTTQAPAPAPAEQPAPTAVNNNIPTTGPSEVIFSAIMVGIVVFLIGLNIQLVKENQ